MKKFSLFIFCFVLCAALSGCGNKVIGTLAGTDHDIVIIGEEEYIRYFDPALSYADKDKYLGKITDGNIVLKAYSLKKDDKKDYVYCVGDQERFIFRKLTSFSSDSLPVYKGLDFKAQYIRSNACSYEEDNEKCIWITNKEELWDYYLQNKEKFYLDKVEKPLSDQTIGFLDGIEKYGEDFFETKDLILLVLEEPSGSIRHEVTEVNLYYSISDKAAYFIQPTIKRTVPEVQTCDMADWHILIEINKEYGKEMAQLKEPEIITENLES